MGICMTVKVSMSNQPTEAMNERGDAKMTAQITKMSFHCELVTIHSKTTFADLISRIEATFQYYDPKTLRNLTAEGDTEKLAAYVKQVGEPTEFAMKDRANHGWQLWDRSCYSKAICGRRRLCLYQWPSRR